MDGETRAVLERVETLESAVREKETRLAALEQALARQDRGRRRWQVLAGSAVLIAVLSWPGAGGAADGGGIAHRVERLEGIFLAPNPINGEPYVQRVGSHLIITGANLCIRNGLGATNGNPADPTVGGAATHVNGLGNLIVGYNESRTLLPDAASYPADDRGGSHTIVVGAFQNYSSYGGLLAGVLNGTGGPYASVSGGSANSATGDYASVSGGTRNTAGGNVSSVSGGEQNMAAGIVAWAAGGLLGQATGSHSSVTGGLFNEAAGSHSSVTGGEINIAGGDLSSVSGGSNVTQSADRGWSAGSLAPVTQQLNARSP